MSITARLEQIRRLHAESLLAGRPHFGATPELKHLVARHAQLRRETGWTWKAISAELPISPTTTRAWMRGVQAEPGGLVPVTLTAESVSPVATKELLLISPAGFRLSGLSLDQAARLLGRLG